VATAERFFHRRPIVFRTLNMRAASTAVEDLRVVIGVA